MNKIAMSLCMQRFGCLHWNYNQSQAVEHGTTFIDRREKVHDMVLYCSSKYIDIQCDLVGT